MTTQTIQDKTYEMRLRLSKKQNDKVKIMKIKNNLKTKEEVIRGLIDKA